MKKLIYTTLALGAVLLAASCQKENTVNTPPVFTAYVDSDTKTVLNGVEKQSLWNQDHILIIDQNNNKKEYQTDATSVSVATFTESNSEQKISEGSVVAICPYEMQKTYSSWDVNNGGYLKNLWMPGSQTAEAGSYDANAYVAVAQTENTTLKFENVFSLMSFTIDEASEDVTSITVSVPLDKFIAGNFTYALTEHKCYQEGNTCLSSVTLTGNFKKGETYYIALLPGTYPSMEVKVNDRKYLTKSTEFSLARNTIYDGGRICLTPVAEKTITMTIDKKNAWDNVYIYAWDSAETKIFGNWPGTLVEGNTVTFPKEYNQADVKFIFSTTVAGDKTIKTIDLSKTLSEDFVFELPSEANSFCVVKDKDKYSNIHIWGAAGDYQTTWPGLKLTSHPVYNYKYCELDENVAARDFSFILSYGGSDKTLDLNTTDYTTKIGTTYYYF